MSTIQVMGAFAQVVEDASALPLDQQESLIEILRSRRIQRRRQEILAEILESEDEYASGLCHPASVEEIMKEATK